METMTTKIETPAERDWKKAVEISKAKAAKGLYRLCGWFADIALGSGSAIDTSEPAALAPAVQDLLFVRFAHPTVHRLDCAMLYRQVGEYCLRRAKEVETENAEVGTPDRPEQKP